jgi:hypothetical protein
MRNILAAALLFAGFALASTTVFAHHGTNTEYDSAHPITVVGTVTEFAFSNPHVQIYFDVKDAKGNVTHWGVESASPGRLVRVGWNRNIIKAGDVLTITLEPARSGASVGGLKKVVFADGRVLDGTATTASLQSPSQ